MDARKICARLGCVDRNDSTKCTYGCPGRQPMRKFDRPAEPQALLVRTAIDTFVCPTCLVDAGLACRVKGQHPARLKLAQAAIIATAKWAEKITF